MKSPAFQLYVNDFLGSAKVGTMSVTEIGVYLMLLFLDWQEVGFPHQEKSLARWCRLSPKKFREAWEAVSPCFVEIDGRMYNPRLRLERQRQAEWREKSSKGGKAGADKRWNHPVTTPITTPITTAIPFDDTPSPTPSPVTTTTPLPPTSADAEGTGKAVSPTPTDLPRSSKKTTRGLVPTREEREVLDHYAKTHPRRGPADDNGIRKVRKALLSFSVEQLKQCIEGNAEDVWHSGKNLHGVTYIFRDNDKISEFVDRYHSQNAPLQDASGNLTEAGKRFFGSAA